MPEVGSLRAKVGLDSAEFNQGIKALSKQMSVVKSEFQLASGSLDKVKDAMQIAQMRAKSLGDQIDIQKKIVSELRSAQQSMADQYGETSKQALDYELKVKKAEITLQSLEKQLQATNKELGSQSVMSVELRQKMINLGNSMEKVGQKMQSVGKALSVGLTAPLLALSAAVGKLTNDLGEYADEIGMAMEQTGMSAEYLQEMHYVTAQLDMDFGVVQNSMIQFTNKMKGVDEGSSEAAKAMQKLGINMNSQMKAGVPLSETYTMVIERLSVMQNESQRNILASAIFGRSWAELAPLLNAGSDSVNRLRERAHELGLVISNDALQAARDYTDQVDELKAQFAAAFREIASNFLPVLTDKVIPFIQAKVIPALKEFGEKVGNLVDWFMQLSPGMQSVIGKTALLAVTIGPALIAIGQMSIGIGVVTKMLASETVQLAINRLAKMAHAVATGVATAAQWAFNAAMTAGLLPVLGVIAAMAALGVAIYAVIKYWKEICEWIEKAWNWLTKWARTDPEDKELTVKENRVVSTTYATTGGSTPLEQRATGDRNWRGGLVRVHEKGGEVMNLPRGTQIIPHDVSMEMARSGALGGGNQYIIQPGGINVTIPVSELKDIQTVADFFNRFPQLARARGSA